MTTNTQTATQEDAQKVRARARRAAKRGSTSYTTEGIQCPMPGCKHTAHSLVTHLSKDHGLKVWEAEQKLGMKPGTLEVCSPELLERLRIAGAKGGAKTKEINAAKAA